MLGQTWGNLWSKEWQQGTNNIQQWDPAYATSPTAAYATWWTAKGYDANWGALPGNVPDPYVIINESWITDGAVIPGGGDVYPAIMRLHQAVYYAAWRQEHVGRATARNTRDLLQLQQMSLYYEALQTGILKDHVSEFTALRNTTTGIATNTQTANLHLAAIKEELLSQGGKLSNMVSGLGVANTSLGLLATESVEQTNVMEDIRDGVFALEDDVATMATGVSQLVVQGAAAAEAAQGQGTLLEGILEKLSETGGTPSLPDPVDPPIMSESLTPPIANVGTPPTAAARNTLGGEVRGVVASAMPGARTWGASLPNWVSTSWFTTFTIPALNFGTATGSPLVVSWTPNTQFNSWVGMFANVLIVGTALWSLSFLWRVLRK